MHKDFWPKISESTPITYLQVPRNKSLFSIEQLPAIGHWSLQSTKAKNVVAPAARHKSGWEATSWNKPGLARPPTQKPHPCKNILKRKLTSAVKQNIEKNTFTPTKGSKKPSRYSATWETPFCSQSILPLQSPHAMKFEQMTFSPQKPLWGFVARCCVSTIGPTYRVAWWGLVWLDYKA